MIEPRSAYHLTPLLQGGLFNSVPPQAELTIDEKHLDYLWTLPYIAAIVRHNTFRNKYFVVFDERYNPNEAWHDLRRELTSQTDEVELDDRIWAQEGEDEDVR